MAEFEEVSYVQDSEDGLVRVTIRRDVDIHTVAGSQEVSGEVFQGVETNPTGKGPD